MAAKKLNPNAKRSKSSGTRAASARTRRTATPRKVSGTVARKTRAKRPPSGLELAVYAILDKQGVRYEKEKQISQCHVDIFIGPRTVIELQGCFWHGCMSCNKRLSAEQKKWQELDGNRHFFLRSLGYDVVVIWEHEVRREPARIEAVLQATANVARLQAAKG